MPARSRHVVCLTLPVDAAYFSSPCTFSAEGGVKEVRAAALIPAADARNALGLAARDERCPASSRGAQCLLAVSQGGQLAKTNTHLAHYNGECNMDAEVPTAVITRFLYL
eukprot:3908394-Pleurochrysis_carterae.AAC.1